WRRGCKRLKLLAPYIWPRNNRLIQLRVVICAALLVLDRVVNLYSPIFYKQIVDSLTVSSNKTDIQASSESYPGNPTIHTGLLHRLFDRLVGEHGLVYRWDYVLQFIAIRFLQGLGSFGGGFINTVRSQLWINVDQFSTRELSVMLFAHLHGLSLQWHLSRKTGEMLRIMDRGTASISNVLSYMLFNIVPTVVDILIGVVYFVVMFNIWYGVLVFITMAVYVVATVLVTEWRAKIRRKMNLLDNQKNTKAVDALLNFETVKYFNAEQFEVNRFKDAFHEYQSAEWWTTTTLNFLNTVQCVTIVLGLMVGTLLCAMDVVEGRLTVGDFVLFYAYMIQLYSPLSLFGTYYRLLQTSVVDMENMFELLDQQADVQDVDDAPDLQVSGSEIEFRNVSFHYAKE
ncbi:ATP binding cassette sub family B, partial [Paragonimus heterotremus]